MLKQDFIILKKVIKILGWQKFNKLNSQHNNKYFQMNFFQFFQNALSPLLVFQLHKFYTYFFFIIKSPFLYSLHIYPAAESLWSHRHAEPLTLLDLIVRWFLQLLNIVAIVRCYHKAWYEPIQIQNNMCNKHIQHIKKRARFCGREERKEKRKMRDHILVNNRTFFIITYLFS